MKFLIVIVFFILSGCTYLSVEELIVDCAKDLLIITINSTEDDCGLNNGSASIMVTGGLQPYSFQINELLQDTNEFTNLAAGNYTVKVFDTNNCFAEKVFVIDNKSGVTASAFSTIAGCETSQATITITAENGNEPYEYRLNGQTPQSSNVFDNLMAGNHTVTVTDNIGCEFIIEEKILSGLSYLQDIQPILMNTCAVSGCHNGSQFPDLRVLANVQNNKVNIRAFTQSRFMPLEGSLTQAEVDALACWIDDGAFDN